MTNEAEYVLDRVFSAPRALVWRAWTDPDLLARWYGPGIETIIHKYDLEPGGLWLNEMKWGEKSDLSRMEFKEVASEERLVWHHASADADWQITSNPMMPDWPRLLLTTVTFSDAGDTTNVRLTQVPIDATDAEKETFSKMMDGMSKGWGSGFGMIDEILVELQS